MRKIFTLLVTAVMAFSLSAAQLAPNVKQLNQGVRSSFKKEVRQVDFRGKKSATKQEIVLGDKTVKMRSLQKVAELDGSPVKRARNGNVFTIDGQYTLTIGDYYFQDSRDAEFTASARIYYDSSNSCYLLDCSSVFPAPIGFDYDPTTKKMNFFQSYIGTSQGYYIVCVPFYWDYNQKSEVWLTTYEVKFDEGIGVFTFDADHGFAWPAFTNSAFTNWGGQYLDMYDVVKGIQAGGGDSLLDNDSNWKDAGTAVLVDGWVLPVFGVNPLDPTFWYEVPIQQSTLNANKYRLVDPYHCNPNFDKGDNTSTSKGYIRFDVSDPNHVVFDTGVEAGWANPEAGVSMMFCFNQLGWYMSSFDVPAQTVISQLGNNIPYTTYKNGIVSLDYITDSGEKIYDATFGYQVNPLLGGYWPGENMSARIYMPGTAALAILDNTMKAEAADKSATISFDYVALGVPAGSTTYAVVKIGSQTTRVEVTGGHAEVVVEGLEPETRYTATVTIEVGQGVFSTQASDAATVTFTTDKATVVIPELPEIPEGADVIYADGKLAANINVENWHNAVLNLTAANPTGADNQVFEFKAGNLTYDWGQAGYTDASAGLNMVKPANTGKFHDATLNFGWYAAKAGAKYTVRLTSIASNNYSFTVTDDQVGKWNVTSLKMSEAFPEVAKEWAEDANYGEGYVFSIIIENGTEADVMYLNNIYYTDVDADWTAPEHVIPAPETVPVPEHDAADVISVFSSKYEPATGFNIGWWGQSTVADLQKIDNADVYYLRNFNYLGWELTSDLNVADYDYMHVDFWTADEGAGFGFTPVTREGTVKEKGLEQQVKLNEWNSYDIALSEWAEAGMDLSTVFQVKYDFGKNKNAYIANVYFWKNPAPAVEYDIEGNLNAQLDMSYGAGEELLDAQDWPVKAAYKEGKLYLTALADAEEPIVMVVNTDDWTVAADGKQLSTKDDGDPEYVIEYYYGDIESQQFTVLGEIRNISDTQSQITLKNWGEAMDWDGGLFFNTAYFNSVLTLDYVFEGAPMLEAPDFDMPENIAGAWTYTLNGHYLGAFSLGQKNLPFTATVEGKNVFFESMDSPFHIAGVFTSPTTIEFRKAGVGNSAAAYMLTQVPYINKNGVNDLDDLESEIVDVVTGTYDAEAGVITFTEGSGLMYGYFNSESGELSYWDDAFDFVVAFKAPDIEVTEATVDQITETSAVITVTPVFAGLPKDAQVYITATDNNERNIEVLFEGESGTSATITVDGLQPNSEYLYFAGAKVMSQGQKVAESETIKLFFTTTGSAVAGTDRAHYAYNLSSEEAGEGAYTISFNSTGDAATAYMVVTDADGNVVDEYEIGSVNKGENTFTYDASDLSKDQRYNWAIRVHNYTIDETKITEPIAIKLNNGVRNDGRAAVVTFTDPEYPEVYGYTVLGLPQNTGINIYNPEGELVAEKLYPKNQAMGANGANGSCPMDGTSRATEAYFASWGDAAAGVVAFDVKAALNDEDATPYSVFEGSQATSGLITNEAGEGVGSGTPTVGVWGKGEQTTIITFDEDNKSLNELGNNLVQNVIGNAFTTSNAATLLAGGLHTELTNTNVAVATAENGVFVTQVRADAMNDQYGYYGLYYVSMPEGKCIWNLNMVAESQPELLPATNAGVDVNREGNLLAVSTYTGINIYNLAYNADGTPVLTLAQSITAPVAGNNRTNVKFDAGGNLHVVSEANGYYIITPAADEAKATTKAPASMVIAGTNEISNIAVDAIDYNATYYNLNGVRVDVRNMVPGVYVKVVGKTATKVVIR